MPKPGERSSGKKFVRTTGGKVAVRYVQGKSSKHRCALCKAILHGVPHGKRKAAVKKLSKSKSRPSGIFGGILCSKCRTNIIEEAIRVEHKLKDIAKVELSNREYVKMALNAVE